MQAAQPSHDSDYLARLATFFLVITGSCKGLQSSKLNSASRIIRKYRKLYIRICFARFSQIQLAKSRLFWSHCRQLSFPATSQRVKGKFAYRKITKAGSAKVNKSAHVKKLTVTTNNRIQAGFNLSQSGERRRSTGHKINSQIECTIIRKVQTSLEMFKTLYSSSDRRMICFYSTIGFSESKVIFK